MLARQAERRPETDESSELLASRLRVVDEGLFGPERERPLRRRRRPLAFISNAINSFFEEARLQPERYARLVDRLILLGIAVVVVVSAYVLIVDPS